MMPIFRSINRLKLSKEIPLLSGFKANQGDLIEEFYIIHSICSNSSYPPNLPLIVFLPKSCLTYLILAVRVRGSRPSPP